MPERKYTYTVEIDASQAKAEAAKLRAMFDQELAQPGRQSGGSSGGGPGASMAADLQKAAPEIEKIKKEIAGLAKIDASTPIEELIADLGTLDRALADARRRMEELSSSAGAMAGRSAREIAEYRDYLFAVEQAAGPEAARAIGGTGKYLSQAERYKEFKNDQESAYLEFARDYHQRNQDTGDNARQSLQAQEEAAKLEAEYYALELQVNQRQQEITRQRLADAERQIAALGALTPENFNDPVWEIADDAQREIAELGEEEARLLRNIAEANDQAATLAAQQAAKVQEEAAKAARKTGDFSGGTAGATTQQVALTVTQKAVTNAQELTAAMRETAGLTERIAENTEKITAADIGRIKTQKEAYVAQEKQREASEIAIKDAERIAALDKEAAHQATIAAQQTKATEAGKTQIAKNESAERLAIARAEATQKSELAKTERINAQREYAAETAAYKKEADARAAAARKTQAGGRSGIGSALGSIGLSPQALIGGAVAGLGLYSIDQIGRNVYDSARSGAQLERMSTTFEQVAARVGISSDAMIASIKSASKETITSAEAMSLGAQILAQKWSSSSDDVIGDTGRLVEASRRLAQIYTDESGQFLTTQEVFARLIKYIREGNKELVDQFGLSNARIAESLGITTKGLAAAGGASDRFRGLIKVLGEDMERLGPAMLTAADKFEQSEARITAAKQRIDRALAGPVAGIAEFVASGTENALVGTDFDITKAVIERQAEATPDNAAYKELISTYQQLEALAASNATAAAFYKQELTSLATVIYSTGAASAEQAAALDKMQRSIQLAASGQDAYSRVMQITTEEALKQDSAIFALARTMGDYQRMYEDGKISLDQYNRLSGQLATTLFNLATAAGMLSPALAGVNAQLAAVPNNPGLLGGSITGNLTQSPGWFEYRQQEDQFRQDRIDAQTARDQAARAEAKRAADAAAKEWENAAKSAAADFEKAAQSAADSFKSSLEAVPGLFGSTEVTAEDMTLAKAGVYQEKADEYLRQLRDEVQNKIDRPGVDIRDAAARAGIDPNAPADVILALFEKAWNDSSLFSGGRNLDLINADAVQAELGRQQASEDGRKAILAYFGLGEDSPLAGAEQSAFTDLIGLDDQSIIDAGATSREKFMEGFSAPAADSTAAGAPADFLTPIVQNMESGINTGDTADRIYGIGGSIAGRLYSGFTDAANNLAWGRPIIDALAASVAPQVYDMLGAELNN